MCSIIHAVRPKGRNVAEHLQHGAQPLKYQSSWLGIPDRYIVEHLGVTLNSITALKDFMRDVVFRIEGKYNDPKACLSSVK